MLEALTPPAEACLVDGFRLGPAAPEHTAVVDGDEKSAAIAAASIVAKVTRDRLMRRLDALYPAYGFAQHVGYITPGHSAVVRALGPSAVHRLSFQALCYEEAVA
jgi:ribonuclease HII